MADDDEGAKPATDSPVQHPAGAVKPGAEDAPQTEWTASDRRGPLGSAGAEDVERVPPAHGTEAEGALDQAEPQDILHPTDPHVGDVVAQASPAPASADDPAATRASTVAPERKRSLVPVAAGLVVGAVIGAGSAWAVYSQAGAGTGDRQQLAALSSRVDALDKRPDPQPELSKLQAGLADLQGKLAALETRSAEPATGEANRTSEATKSSKDQVAAKVATPEAPAPSPSAAPPADAGLAGKVAALQAALDELRTRTSSLQAQDAKQDGSAAKVASLQTGIANAQKQAAGAQTALDALKSEQKELGDKVAGLTIAVAGALKKAEGAQTDAETVQARQKTLESKLGSPALAVVADSLVEQIGAGQPFARQVDALAALNADPTKVAVLRENAGRGVPSAQSLLAQWKPLASPVIASGNKAPANAGLGQRLEHGLFGLVSVHRADGTTGNDLASRVNQIEADLGHGDVPAAYAAWQALPADAKARSDSWGALAKTSVEALAAARDLQHSAIDALGAKKS